MTRASNLLLATSIVKDRWVHGEARLEDACIELAVLYELFECRLDDADSESEYWRLGAVGRFAWFLKANDLPDMRSTTDDSITGLDLEDLLLVWIHQKVRFVKVCANQFAVGAVADEAIALDLALLSLPTGRGQQAI